MTSPTPLVTPADVCRLQAVTAPEADSPEGLRLTDLCERASATIRSRVVAVDGRIAAGTLDAVLVRGVAVDMVLAALENIGLGFRNTGEQYPEWQSTNVASSARLTVEMTDAQRASLMPPDPTAGGGMYSVPLGG